MVARAQEEATRTRQQTWEVQFMAVSFRRLILATGMFLLAPIAPGAAAGHARPPDVHSLEVVYPRLAGQNRVRWWEFDWKWTELHPVEDAAGVRVYFYQSEKEIARVAASEIEAVFREYVDRFEYRPSRITPFQLYNSHFEFESTNAFLVQEQLLGVTSIEDLTLALPYWGEHQRFRHVLRHELAHVFTIQKVVDAARKADVESPLGGIPLWFVEGTAEFFALGDLTPEKRGLLAAILLERAGGRKLPGFFDEGPMDFERVYQLGHAQVLFLERTFGDGTARRILADTSRLAASGKRRISSFEQLVVETVGTPAREIDRQWKSWVKTTIGPDVADASQRLFMLDAMEDAGGDEIDSFTVGPDGRTVMFRTFNRSSQVAGLYLRDFDDGRSTKRIAQDKRPGLVSLHPLDRSVSAIGRDYIAWIGRVAATDVLFVRRFRREESDGRVRFALQKTRRIELSAHDDLIEAGHPAIDPASGALVFSGLSRRTGFLDVYRISDPFGADPRIEKLTDDPYAQRDLAYLPDGSLLLASDATSDGRFEIFRLEPDGQVALTEFAGDVDATAPAPDRSGGFVFQATRGGRQQAYRWGAPPEQRTSPPPVGMGPGSRRRSPPAPPPVGEPQPVRGEEAHIHRLTDVPTFFASPAVDADGNLLGLVLDGERPRLVRLAAGNWLEEPVDAIASGEPEPWPVRRLEFDRVRDYQPFRPSNLQIADARLFFASGPFFLGSLVTTDRFRDHVIGFQARVFGSLDRSEADLFYINRSGRWGRGGRAFVETALQLDPDFVETQDAFLIRRMGAAALAEYPFGRFSRIEGFAAPMVIEAFEFSRPEGEFARRNRGRFPAARAGLGYGLDTIRRSGLIGPAQGYSFVADVEGTWLFQSLDEVPAGGRTPPDPFLELNSDFNTYRPLGRELSGPYLHGRLAAGTSLGGVFREQFYLPASYNLRALRTDSEEQLGQHYYVSTAELLVPIPLGENFGPTLEAVAGADLGGIFFEPEDAWNSRRAAGVLGGNLGLGFFALRVHFARPVDLGTGGIDRGWITHVTLDSPLFYF